MLNWAKQFGIFCLLDNHQYNFFKPAFECLLAVGSVTTLQPGPGNVFPQLQHFIDKSNDWIFGHIAYDIKNEIETLSSANFDGIEFPEISFFVPEIILILKNNSLQIGAATDDANNVYNSILSQPDKVNFSSFVINLCPRFSKDEYLQTVNKLRRHILRGDCYEINFCQEFYSENCEIEPLQVYLQLSRHSPNPFAAFYKLNDKYAICSSPERYVKRDGNKIFSQPIKGTAKRNRENNLEDEKNKTSLLESKKETSENVMVVDLVRNDLSKICEEGTVKVDELFGIYSFPNVHQMISTVSGTIKRSKTFSEIIKATFPMGSMTGAPKKNVMQLIEKYEKTKRGLFSGAIGYIKPNGDFDFNVVIRSMLYNASKKYVSIQAGSAITFYSNAEDEYEECLLKMEGLKKALM